MQTKRNQRFKAICKPNLTARELSCNIRMFSKHFNLYPNQSLILSTQAVITIFLIFSAQNLIMSNSTQVNYQPFSDSQCSRRNRLHETWKQSKATCYSVSNLLSQASNNGVRHPIILRCTFGHSTNWIASFS